MNDKRTKKPFYLLMSGLLIIFALPMIVAWLMYCNNYRIGFKTDNYGQLIQPPLDFSQLPVFTPQGEKYNTQSLRGKWLLLYVSPVSYDPWCEKNLYKMRQIRIATGKDMQRIARAVLTFSHEPIDNQLSQLLNKEYAGTVHLVANREEFAKFIKSSHDRILQQGCLYLVDPLGNIMMVYEPTVNSDPIYKDVVHLLNASQIG